MHEGGDIKPAWIFCCLARTIVRGGVFGSLRWDLELFPQEGVGGGGIEKNRDK